MDIPIVNIESDVVENIFRPISLFLNEVKAGTELTFISVYETEGRVDPTKPVYHYKFLASDGNIYSFTQYDLSQFTINGVSLRDVLRVQREKQAMLCTSFKVLGDTPRKTRDGDIMYPPFAYTGYDTYMEQLDAGGDRAKLRKQLFASKVSDDYKDRYYRTVDIDKPIVYYDED